MSARSRSKPWFAMPLKQRVRLEASTTAQQLMILQLELALDQLVARHIVRWETARAVVAELLLEVKRR